MEQAFLDSIFLPAALGGIGGLTRGFIGLLKALSLRRKILWGYYSITVLVALIIGIFVGLIFMTQITVTLNAEEEKALTKRAKKNLMTLEEQIHDIIRRSCVTSSKTPIPKLDIDDKLVSIFSRHKTGKKR
jgi:uncharacterized membrane protein (Fun14 family)